MPDTTPTEEHQRVRRVRSIGDRALLYDWLCSGVIPFIIIAVMMVMAVFTLKETFIYWLIFGVALCCLYRVIRQLMVRAIAREITSPEDFESGLQQYTEKSPILQQLLSEQQKGSIEYQLLRPSQPAESDDTLLRAATSTDNAPQDQLLRPTAPDHPTT